MLCVSRYQYLRLQQQFMMMRGLQFRQQNALAFALKGEQRLELGDAVTQLCGERETEWSE